MVITARRNEERRVPVALGQVEAKRAHVELFCSRKIGDMQVDVAHDGFRGEARPAQGFTAQIAQQMLDVERRRPHAQAVAVAGHSARGRSR